MSNQVATQERELQVIDTLQLESIQNQLNSLLADNPREKEKFKARMIKFATSYMLKDCTPQSIIACGVQALTLDLPLEAGQGYIVKYGNEAQLDVGYRGWLILAKRSGVSALADPVYKCDFFEQKGFGFEAELNMEPNHVERKQADDKWVEQNIVGVIVSLREDTSNLLVTRFVDRDTLFKIVGMSPSTKTEKARQFSPHENWRAQMLAAKALKQVISKMPIEISQDSKLHEAIRVVNETESAAQQKAAPVSSMPEYSAERFEEMLPKWIAIVESGKKTANDILTQMSNSFKLTGKQLERLGELRSYEIIDGESTVVPEDMAEAS